MVKKLKPYIKTEKFKAPPVKPKYSKKVIQEALRIIEEAREIREKYEASLKQRFQAAN